MYRTSVELEPPVAQHATRIVHSRVLPSHGWRTVSFITWIATLAALVAVAISSRTIGQPVWWLGPRADPASPLFMLIPLTMIVVPLVATWRAPHNMVSVNVVCSLLLIATALPDIGRSVAIAAAVGTVGLASFLSSIAQLLVMRKYR
ncbi:MAG: hypothetical protein RIR69_70 [Actinomycetota bacterium]